MNKTILGNSNLEISPLAFGAWAIGGKAWGGNEEKDSLDAIRAAINSGISTLDTAPIYGYGLSEELIGKVVKKDKGRDKLQILTKFGINWQTKKGQFYFEGEVEGRKIPVHLYSGKDGIIKECEESLKRLNTDYIDLYQAHRPDPTTDISETMEALSQLKKEGKILEGAVSNYTVDQLNESLNYFPVISNQLPFSMLEMDIKKEMVPFCLEKNIGILAYSPLQRGVLTGKYSGDINWDDDDHRKDTKWFKDENRKNINAYLSEIKPIADSYHISISQLVINWTISQKGISCVLVGGRNSAQVKHNAESLKFKLDESEIRFIDEKLGHLKLLD